MGLARAGQGENAEEGRKRQSPQIEDQKSEKERDSRHPPEPVNAAGLDRGGREFLLHELVVVKIVVRNPQAIGDGGFRPSRLLVRPASGARLGAGRHDCAAIGTNLRSHQIIADCRFSIADCYPASITDGLGNRQSAINNWQFPYPPTPAYSSSVRRSRPIKI